MNNNIIYKMNPAKAKNQNTREDRQYSTTLKKKCGFDPVFF